MNTEAPLPSTEPVVQPAQERSEQESDRALRARLLAAIPSTPWKFNRFFVFLYGAAVVVVALATTVLLRSRHREDPANKSVVAASVPVSAPTYMEINASPWARVLQVKDAAGKTIRLPEDGTTPLRLNDLTAGQYTVTLAGPDGDKRIVNCSVSDNHHLCMLPIETPDIQQVVTGANP